MSTSQSQEPGNRLPDIAGDLAGATRLKLLTWGEGFTQDYPGGPDRIPRIPVSRGEEQRVGAVTTEAVGRHDVREAKSQGMQADSRSRAGDTVLPLTVSRKNAALLSP